MIFTHHRRIAIFAAALCALWLSACTTSSHVEGARSRMKPASQRKSAPEFNLKDADGKSVRLSDYRGKVVLLNFWATWCGPCKVEIPWFIEFERRHKDQGFAVVGISMDEDGWQSVKPFISEAGINYRVLLGDEAISGLYGGVDSLPTTFILDRDGRIAATHLGLVSKNIYEHDLAELFDSGGATRASGGPVSLARSN